MTAPDLKPCPFCGGTDLEIREMGEEWHVVSCNGCNAEGGYYLPDDSTMPEEAAELWNRRPTPRAEALAVPEIAALGEAALDHMLDRRGIKHLLSQIKEEDPEVWCEICEETGRAALRAIGEGKA